MNLAGNFTYHLAALEGMDSRFAPNKSRLVAFCTSDGCSKRKLRGDKYNEHLYTKYGTIKKVPKTLIFCPDCSSALYWVRESEIRNAEKRGL